MATRRSRNRMHALDYSPYGYLAEHGFAGVLRFTGQRRDTDAGGYLLGNGYRLFNPSLMRFARPDTVSPFGVGGLNPYAYCSGDPVNMWDPSGKAGQRTGLTALLNNFGLPKKDLKFHLKSLATPAHKGQWLYVKKRTGDQFTTYRFTGDHPLITGRQEGPVETRSQVAGVFFTKGDVYIPSPRFDHPGINLIAKGYKREVLASETHAFILPAAGAGLTVANQNSGPPGISRRQRAVPNDYVGDIRR